ncbi:mannonate dehydratase [Leeuwenhoekiella sp. W20_SRS_FM14]|uniref:mannonate dehydratase n=1 Tax=Leeuwenhoekiella sp. W20_SRS_FM14 TaxID=3240270 RepID=UPI003F94DAEA
MKTQFRTQQTMRWFGPGDAIALRDIRQCGVTGIVTALHEIPVGEVWSIEVIQERQALLEKEGLEWTVVESLPVSEDIKKQNGNYKTHIANYKTSIANLAACGIYVITYNFMPILDWVRTHHNHVNQDLTQALLYDHTAFIFFDVYLLNRPGSELDYSEQQLKDALKYGTNLSEVEKKTLFKNVLLGLPGSKGHFTAEQILTLLENYKDIDDEKLRKHLIYFLQEVAPVAEKYSVKLAIHPDDPPFSVMGLPRVVCTQADLKQIFDAVPLTANGLCYCTGSLGAEPTNDLLQIIDDCADRIHFLHLRNIIRTDENIFQESAHLDGDNPIAAIMQKLVNLMQTRKVNLPLRPDHGFLHSLELGKEQYPGYSLIGRLKGLAELRGLEEGILHNLQS